MQAALKQKTIQDYEEGYRIYKRLSRLGYMTLPTYEVAMKLLGKLGKFDEVDRLWDQLVELDHSNQVNVERRHIDPVIAAARMQAAADEGDIQGAARVLDYMERNGIAANKVHFTSAINACVNAAQHDRAKAAQRFFDKMVANDIVPDIVAYCSLLRAYQGESSECCLRLIADMKGRGITPNKVFAENFLFTLLGIRKAQRKFTKRSMLSSLKQRSAADRQAARAFIDDLRDENIRLTLAGKVIDAALQAIPY
ncbi:unnamed protein product [Durusdinium trenchii]|uniref:Mitochondrial n=2 Tax=Durusdinium trenchii TaxID=1381693 RepID=A0ABP0I6A6_9DINO